MKKSKIFIACDTSKISEAKKIIAQTKTKKLDIGYKFGLEFFYSRGGREFISKLKNEKIFADMKISDISNTSASAINSLKDLKNINYITVHANAGEDTLKAVVKMAKKTNKKLKILDRFAEEDIKFNKLNFLKVGNKYKVLQNWRDINDWLQSTFHNIITK